MFTLDQLEATVRSLAAAEPARVNDGTYLVERYDYYEEEDIIEVTPCCIFGHAIAALDPDYYIHLSDAGNTTGIKDVLDSFSRAGILFSSISDHPNTVEWMGMVQTCQDQSEPWGKAVAEADRWLALQQKG